MVWFLQSLQFECRKFVRISNQFKIQTLHKFCVRPFDCRYCEADSFESYSRLRVVSAKSRVFIVACVRCIETEPRPHVPHRQTTPETDNVKSKIYIRDAINQIARNKHQNYVINKRNS